MNNDSNDSQKQSEIIECPNCESNFNEDNKRPYSLPDCKHALCKSCLEKIIKTTDSYECKYCQTENKFKSKKIDDYTLLEFKSFEEDSNEDQVEEDGLCHLHINKEVEYFCDECEIVICVDCIYEKHNGHKFSTLFDKSNIIKHNMRDFKRVVSNLKQVNSDNLKIIEGRFEEISNLKNTQIQIVNKVFQDVAVAILNKRNEFLKEFDEKYNYEDKRFNKLMTLMMNIENEVQTILDINEELLNFSESREPSVVLKKTDDYIFFLQKSYMDIKRLYNTEMSLKSELKMDSGINPININVKNLLLIIEKINTKEICYNNIKNNNMENIGNIENNDHILKNYKDYISKNHKKDEKKNDNYNDNSSSDLTGMNINPHKKIQFDKIAEDIINLRGSLRMINKSVSKSDSENDIFHKKNNNVKNNNPQFVDIPRPNQRHTQKVNNNPQFKSQNYLSNNQNLSNQSNNASSRNNISNEKSNNLKSSDLKKGRINKIPNTEIHTSKITNPIKNSQSSSKKSSIYITNPSPYKFTLPRLSSIENKENILSLKDSLVKGISTKDFSPCIISISESSFVLKFHFDNQKWNLERLENISVFDGGLRYSSLICTNKDKILLSGGCDINTNIPSNELYELNSTNCNRSKKLKEMTYKRWGHMSCYISPYVYFIGGFDHNYNSKSFSTLKYCERFNILTEKNEGIAVMNQARALSGICVVNKDQIFIFGGYHNDKLISSIEKYDTQVNVWVVYQVRLFDSFAKMGVVNMNNNIFILGGINEEYQITNKVVVLELSKGQWKKIPEMQSKRTFNNSSFLYNNSIYVIGGDSNCSCERFDFLSQKWMYIESYSNVLHVMKNKLSGWDGNSELYSNAFSLNFIQE